MVAAAPPVAVAPSTVYERDSSLASLKRDLDVLKSVLLMSVQQQQQQQQQQHTGEGKAASRGNSIHIISGR